VLGRSRNNPLALISLLSDVMDWPMDFDVDGA